MTQAVCATLDESDGWILQGPGIAVPAGSIWDAVEHTLREAPDTACLSCGGQVLNRGQVLDAVSRYPNVVPAFGRIGLHMARSAGSVLATLAIWQRRAAYVPLAIEHPAARVAAMATQCALDLIISDSTLDIPDYMLLCTAIVLDQTVLFYVPSTHRVVEAQDDRLCYIAHTSATTGAPKGAMVSHAGLLHRIACMQRLLEVRDDDRFVYKTSVVFDVHVWEFVLPLVSGCRLSIYPQSGVFNLSALLKLVAADGVTVMGLVPTLLQLALKSQAFKSNRVLRAVFCGGESWRMTLAREFNRTLPGCALYNSYGPAETTLAVCNFKVSDDGEGDVVALGDPLGDTVFVIAPTHAAGNGAVLGELLIGGPQVAMGYAGGIAGERFATRCVNGRMMRFYASGDIVRLEPATGAIYFQHRQDSQAKVNGVRIELEEVDAVVGAVPGIEGCSAFVLGGEAAQVWVAYTTDPAGSVDEALIRDACRAFLPAAAVPARFHAVTALPLRPSGKIDRAALSQMFLQTNDAGGSAYAA